MTTPNPSHSPPTTDVLALSSAQTWQPILQLSNQVVLYNPTSHALSIRSNRDLHPPVPVPLPVSVPAVPVPVPPSQSPLSCPYCNRPLPAPHSNHNAHRPPYSRASNYFQLLAIANETSSRPSTPPPSRSFTPSPSPSSSPSSSSQTQTQPQPQTRPRSSTFAPDVMAEGYFKAFFREECRLGMGANGSVFLCQHVLDGNPLGHFAIKKIAVGESHSYLIKILREVRLLESLHHPNIITYHHAWLESCRFSNFGPVVPTLHVLMQWAEGGSLDDFIDARLGKRSTSTPFPISSHPPYNDNDTDIEINNENDTQNENPAQSRSGRIRAFRAAQSQSRTQLQPPSHSQSPTQPQPHTHFQPETPSQKRARHTENDRRRSGRLKMRLQGVHLMSAEEVRGIGGDVVCGLAFLHDRSILHLDLKPGNVLLTWDDGKLIPRAMLSDFGTSRDMLHSSRAQRSGNTGTLEYTSPESLPSLQTGLLAQMDSKADMWSLGMILHKILFFRLPYDHASDSIAGPDGGGGGGRERGDGDGDALEREVREYSGFKSTPALVTNFGSRRLPQAYLVLLENLLHVVPAQRPTCERVVSALREGKLDPVKRDERHDTRSHSDSLVPVSRMAILDSSSSSTSSSSSSEDVQAEAEIEEEEQEQELYVKEEEHSSPRFSEKTPLLALPAPPEAVYPRSAWTLVGGLVPPLAYVNTRVVRYWNRGVAGRLVKSCILVVKVWMLFSICPNPGTHLRGTIMATMLSLAVSDTLVENLWVSFGLGAVHVLVVMLGRSSSERCCTPSLI